VFVTFVAFDTFGALATTDSATDSTTDSTAGSTTPGDGATNGEGVTDGEGTMGTMEGAMEGTTPGDGAMEDGDGTTEGTTGAICGDRSAYMSYTVVMLTDVFDAFVDSLENMIALEQLAAKRSMWFIYS
jgi:hypothetical protein